MRVNVNEFWFWIICSTKLLFLYETKNIIKNIAIPISLFPFIPLYFPSVADVRNKSYWMYVKRHEVKTSEIVGKCFAYPFKTSFE